VLARRAAALGVEIRRGLGVTDFQQTAEGVMVQAGNREFQGKWLVGCDGSRSVVRKAGGFEFAGTEPEFTGYSVKADFAGPGGGIRYVSGRAKEQFGLSALLIRPDGFIAFASNSDPDLNQLEKTVATIRAKPGAPHLASEMWASSEARSSQDADRKHALIWSDPVNRCGLWGCCWLFEDRASSSRSMFIDDRSI